MTQCQFSLGLRPSTAYPRSRSKDISSGFTNYGGQGIVKYVDVGMTHYFNKNMSTYVGYKINLLGDDNSTHDASIATDDIAALGLVHQF